MRKRLGFLLHLNVAESVLLLICIWAGFSFLFLGVRPTSGQFAKLLPVGFQYLWNAALFAFGLTALSSYFWKDLVTRNLLRFFSLVGITAALLGYSIGLWYVVQHSESLSKAEKSPIPFVTLFLFCLIFAGSALQTFLTMSWRPKA